MNCPKLLRSLQKSAVILLGASALVGLPIGLAGVGSGVLAFVVIYVYLYVGLVVFHYRHD